MEAALTHSLILALLLTAPASADGAIPTSHGSLWTAWSWDPLLLASLGLASWLYGRGLLALWQKSRIGHGVSVGQAYAFEGGLLLIFLALLSPLNALSSQLSAAHMVQHMLLMMLAAPLLAFGSPGFVMLWALSTRWRRMAGPWFLWLETWQSGSITLPAKRRPVGTRLWQPLLIWSLYAITLWIWHLPALYQAALRRHLVHEAQHVAFLMTAVLFWRVLLDPIGRLRLSRGAGVLYLFATSLHAGALGGFMALSPRAWYPAYAATAAAWGLTPLADQQLAGLIMWMPACSIYTLAAAALFFTWLREAEVRSMRRDEVPNVKSYRDGQDEQDGRGERAAAWTASGS